MVHVGPTLKIIVRRWFWTSKDVYWGAIYVFFQIRRSWKSWGGTDLFLWKILESQLEINKRLLGGYNNILLKVVLSDNPHANYQRYAQWELSYWFMITLQFRGGVIQFFNYQIRSQNIAEVPLEIYEPCSKVWWPHNPFIYVFYDKSNFKKQWFQRNLI